MSYTFIMDVPVYDDPDEIIKQYANIAELISA